MTDKQILFCKEYIVDLNATYAARRAGYAEENAKQIGYELLNKDEIAEYIQSLITERYKRCQISADDVIYELKNVGTSNIQDYMDDNLNIKPLSQLSIHKAKAIKSIKKTITEGEFGTKTQIEFTLHDKLSGLDKLGRHIGLYTADNILKVIQEQPMFGDE